MLSTSIFDLPISQGEQQYCILITDKIPKNAYYQQFLGKQCFIIRNYFHSFTHTTFFSKNIIQMLNVSWFCTWKQAQGHWYLPSLRDGCKLKVWLCLPVQSKETFRVSFINLLFVIFLFFLQLFHKLHSHRNVKPCSGKVTKWSHWKMTSFFPYLQLFLIYLYFVRI